MFVILCILFAFGIYVQSIFQFEPSLVFFSLFICFLAGLLSFGRKPSLSIVLLLFSFFLAGILRLSISTIWEPVPERYKDISFFLAKVEEKNERGAILSVKDPKELQGLKAFFKTEGLKDDIRSGDSIALLGKLQELNPRLKNPYLVNWRWLKSLEGVRYRISGYVIEKKENPGFVANLRRLVEDKIERLSLSQEGIIKALALGDRSSIDSQVRELFYKTGTAHILAISGLHMGVIASFFFFITKRLLGISLALRLSGNESRISAILTLPALTFFMVFFGSSPSTVRATLMIGIYMLAVVLERQRHILSTLALSGLVILVLSPHSLFTPSFQLSFMSVLFIVIFFNRFSLHLRKIKNRALKWIVGSIICSQGALLGTLPVTLYHFYGFNPLSFLYNLISVPLLCGITVPLTLLGAFVPYADILLKISDLLIRFNLRILEITEFGYIFPFFRPLLFESLLYYGLLLCLLYLDKRGVRFLFLSVLIPVISLYAFYTYSEIYGDKLCVNFLDVGSGEAILVEAPNGIRLMVDSGAAYGDFDAGRSIITPILLSKKILRLDYLILTHPHGDHIGGCLSILENFDVRRTAIGPFVSESAMMTKILETLDKKNVTLEVWREGHYLALGNELHIYVINPPKDFLYEDANDNSIVFKLVYRDVSFLFTGDITEKVENRLISQFEKLNADILKVPHHGSLSSSSVGFLLAVRPKMAILTGRTKEGELSKRVLRTYEILNIPVLSTSDSGFTRVCTEGSKLFVSVFSK
ncbi:MAG: DNA internalization-related competence protein ComEC/Rec2 [Deltaproteobacteria bacterium]|nr:DNA internalization-related competence protein ComEC/Rec2 [Deltaproteobacteria bacterium]